MITIIAFILIAVSFAKFILFSDFEAGGALTLITENVNNALLCDIAVGDDIFDTLTKRRIGKIDAIDIVEEGDDIHLVIRTEAKYFPRGNAVRTAKVWLPCKAIKQ